MIRRRYSSSPLEQPRRKEEEKCCSLLVIKGENSDDFVGRVKGLLYQVICKM